MREVKIYTLLSSSPERNSNLFREILCEGFDEAKARDAAKQRLVSEFGGDFWNMKLANQFSPHSAEYHYYAVPGVPLPDVDPERLDFDRKEEACRPVQEEMGWSGTYLGILDGKCVCLPSAHQEASTEHGIYSLEDYKKELDGK